MSPAVSVLFSLMATSPPPAARPSLSMLLALQIPFAVMAAMVVIGGFKVVTTKNIMHAALWLTVTLSGVAGLYILLASEFVAAVQVMVYIGAVIVLFIFGVMLTRAPIGKEAELNNDSGFSGPFGVLAAISIFGLLTATVVGAFGRTRLDPGVIGSGTVGESIFSEYVIPFEILSVLLLAALIGAIVLARQD